jgi:hypothetical protein
MISVDNSYVHVRCTLGSHAFAVAHTYYCCFVVPVYVCLLQPFVASTFVSRLLGYNEAPATARDLQEARHAHDAKVNTNTTVLLIDFTVALLYCTACKCVYLWRSACCELHVAMAMLIPPTLYMRSGSLTYCYRQSALML